MANKLTFYSAVQDAAHATVVLRNTSDASGGSFTATYTADGSNGKYTGTFPAVAAGLYFWRAVSNTNGILLAVGGVAWDGAAIIEPTAQTATALLAFETLYAAGATQVTFTSGDDTALTYAGGLRANSLVGCVACITSGVLATQCRRISANTSTTITLATPFSEDPIALGGTVDVLILGRIE